MYCTTLFLQKRIYHCLSLLLVISLLFQAFPSIRPGYGSLPQEREIWDETLVSWLRRKWSRRRYRRHTLVGRLHFLKRRGMILFCRLGLMAVLLVWSGWPQRQPISWAVLSLPLADVLISLLPLYWPGVLKVRAYPHLARGAHHLYRLALMALFSTGLSFPGSVGGLWMMGGCVKMADGAWARGEIMEDGTWRLEMKGHFILTYKPRDFFEERVLLVLMRQLRTPQSTSKRPFLRQEWHLSCTLYLSVQDRCGQVQGWPSGLAPIRS